MRGSVALLVVLGVVGCGGSEPQAKSVDSTATSSSTAATASGAAATGGKVTSFKVAAESLKVDKVGGSDGSLKPDNSPDLVFEADVEGPISAVFLISTDAKGSPNGDYQADSIVGLDELPKDFPLATRAGMLTAGVGVWEGDRMISRSDGSIEPIGAGTHHIKLYVASTGVLQPGSGHVQLWVMRSDKSVAHGPVADL